MPGRVGMVSGLFFGFAFGIGGMGAAALGGLADWQGIQFVFLLCSFLPAIGVLAFFLRTFRATRRPEALLERARSSPHGVGRRLSHICAGFVDERRAPMPSLPVGSKRGSPIGFDWSLDPRPTARLGPTGFGWLTSTVTSMPSSSPEAPKKAPLKGAGLVGIARNCDADKIFAVKPIRWVELDRSLCPGDPRH